MKKYGFRPYNTEEFIKTVNCNSLEEAKIIFSKTKVLEINTFNKLYEVVKA